MNQTTPAMNARFAFPLPTPRSRRSRLIAQWFGLSDANKKIRCDRQIDSEVVPLIPLPGQIVLISGASGSGKSSLLRMMKDHVSKNISSRVIDLAEIALPDRPVIDCFDGMRLTDVLGLLSRVGLAEAWTYLRTPLELSEGQRWRLRLGLALAACGKEPCAAACSRRASSPCSTNETASKLTCYTQRSPSLEHPPTILCCDEFAAVLDRVTAAVIAHALRRMVTSESGLGAVLATSHDDLVEALHPDLHVRCDFGDLKIESA